MWRNVLRGLGYSQQQITATDNIQPYFRNCFLVRPHLMIKLIRHMNIAMDIALTNRNVSSHLSKSTRYKNNGEITHRVFKQSNWELWPFIFERLPIFFFHIFEAKVYYHSVSCGIVKNN